MKLTRTISIVVLCAQFGLGAVNAQSLRNSDEPAEFPPASYKSTQYVDSRGCAYIRAGIDGLTTWVPRVTRSRKQICGMQPSLGRAVAQAPAAAAPVTVPAPKPVKVASAPVVASAAARTPTARTPTVRTPVRAPMKTVASIATPPRVMNSVPSTAPRQIAVYSSAPATVAPAPVRRVAVAPGRRTVAAPQVARASTCAGLSPVAQRYMGSAADVRCGPQADSPVTYGTGSGRVVAPAERVYVPVAALPAARAATARVTTGQTQVVRVTPTTRVTPRHVYITQAESADVGKVPAGYRRVWEDDRLNPKRAHQTLAGKAKMELRWTREVPRRLVDITTGQIVTSFYPDLVYPYTSMEMQQRAGVKVATAQPRVTGRLSSKSTSPRQPVAQNVVQPAASAGFRYVQVGTFGVEANARSTIARLQGMGLPVRVGTSQRGGKSLKTVVVGPFASAGELNSALGKARSAGFRDAFLRR